MTFLTSPPSPWPGDSDAEVFLVIVVWFVEGLEQGDAVLVGHGGRGGEEGVGKGLTAVSREQSVAWPEAAARQTGRGTSLDQFNWLETTGFNDKRKKIQQRER